ncbi:hypothetical protein T440DRAFT_476975 [Plenodomus tracheiphilus IPT5]|uniref:Uncharacterized protein n=1 Tax=Plenodomus tracheiphilus IPT5 TaxID=1408161 RepID=A0A6A7BCI8_9PLEO|nr:hypothetical protein T440DRAFT_476975 [Plenodomus tracheiphilus IPT5]
MHLHILFLFFHIPQYSTSPPPQNPHHHLSHRPPLPEPEIRVSHPLATIKVLVLQEKLNRYFALAQQQHHQGKQKCIQTTSEIGTVKGSKEDDEEELEELVLQMQILMKLAEIGLYMKRRGVRWPDNGQESEVKINGVYERVERTIFGQVDASSE